MTYQDPWPAYERVQGRDIAGLTEKELLLRALGDLRSEINSGGFSAYFWYSYGDLAEQAAVACAAVAPGLEALLRRAMSVFGARYPTDIDQRQELLDGSDEIEDRLTALDDEFYQLEDETDLDAAMARLLL